ncbi:tetratricopeptide repeat protein [Tengunoibacter tsumagoiensis]|uniref:Uncharacterized protein n=1 Tax=Tengunoibacter tsumagoiensis TaxID=2014871 RepID=A0A402A0I1_9CHLR|nr:tetratricopeptide repeat protein [Tengunoibacter tsumagoiensis]GCE12569.1 hypothetical protein KTT_24280 [Tengunoibacter tsumagoiensis]
MAQITLRDYLQETEDAIASDRLDEALASCQYILAYFPASLEAQRLLGEIYLAQGRLEEAQHAFDWVLTNDPENVITYCNRALVSERLSDYDTALDCYQQAYELSRGNSQIRQQFNQLSEKTGQPGFMFSRAGLARLYLRGGLLSQALQEWEIVLAASPERLDARTGLLETYWREALYEQVAELAAQILRDVPGCVKALLLQAYVTASKDLAQAQEILRKAEASDPDLLMAHDLFADQLASHPGDPFLALLQREPVYLGVPRGEAATSSAARATGISSSGLSGWGGSEQSTTDTTWIKPRSSSQEKVQQATSAAGLSFSSDTLAQAGTPALDEQGYEAQPSWTSEQQLLENALHGIAPEAPASIAPLQEHSSWDGLTAEDEVPEIDEVDDAQGAFWNLAPPKQESGSSWNDPLQSSSLSAPPAWLSMLTQDDRRQMTGNMPAISLSKQPVEPALSAQVQPPMPQQEPASDLYQSLAPSSPLPEQPESVIEQQGQKAHISESAVPVKSQEQVISPVSEPVSLQNDDEDSFFGPEWLKSLGALGDEEVEEPVVELVQNEPVADTYEPVASEEKPVQEEVSTQPAVQPDWLSQLNPPSTGYDAWQQSAEVQQPSWLAQLEQTPSQSEAHASWQLSPAESAEEQTAASSWLDRVDATTGAQSAQPLQPSWLSQLGGQETEESPYAAWEGQSTNGHTAQSEGASWLAQLGATSSSPEMDEPFQTAPQTESVSPYENWLSYTQEPEPPAQQAEENLLTTLEELEKSLRSKGFIDLEPKSLSAIAQQEEALAQEASQPEPVPSAHPTLASALAELGQFANQTPPVENASSVVEEVQETTAEPSWLAALRSVPTPVAPQREEAVPAYHQPVVPPTLPKPKNPVSSDLPAAHEVRPEAPIFEPTTFVPPTISEIHETVKVPVAHVNPLLDNELETTMKRPAVRLQPIHQQRSLSQRDLAAASPRERSVERTPVKASEGTGNNRDRLLKGYQNQLVGEYDGAMAEYRIIIRNAPELLGEVVSNVRALLKLAPNYSAGYRVLGDAYMRQGEYLQAMEAYNKALTMTKKKN